MKKSLLFAVLLLAAIFLVGAVFLLAPSRAITNSPPLSSSSTAPLTITFENRAFTPAELDAKVGDTVTLVNKSADPLHVASNPHPTHTSYPAWNSGILATGASWTFTFTKVITFSYHDHFDPGAQGKVVVRP